MRENERCENKTNRLRDGWRCSAVRDDDEERCLKEKTNSKKQKKKKGKMARSKMEKDKMEIEKVAVETSELKNAGSLIVAIFGPGRKARPRARKRKSEREKKTR